MNDLISRDAAIEAAIDGVDDWDGGCNFSREKYIERHMLEVPAIDAVVIVRCKDCKYWKDQSATSKWLPCCEMQTSGNWYCAGGEKK